MPPRRRFDKKSAKTFSVVHRAHDDALYYDNDASTHVLVPAQPRQEKKSTSKKIYSTVDLEKKLNPDEIKSIRENEGLAAQYGIYYDDTNYDYMQHLMPMGAGDGVFIGTKGDVETKKTNIEELFKDQLPSERKRKVTHDTFQNIPEELRGFNPNMDPRLREVLEALDDEAYILEEEEEVQGDIFDDLLKSGEVEDEDDFYYGSDAEGNYDDDYDEWDLDNYEDEYNANYDSDKYEEAEIPYNEGEAPEELNENPVSFLNNNWEKDFRKFKAENKNTTNEWDSDNDFEDEEDVVPDLPSFNGSKKKISKTKLRKKKGAMTDTSSFSMSSSALFRTEGLTLLDDRYEQLAKTFEDEGEEDDEDYQPFNMAKERSDLEDMLDDFLDNYELESGGRKLVKKDEMKRKIQDAADSVSKSKASARRRKEKDPLGKLTGSFGKLGI